MNSDQTGLMGVDLSYIVPGPSIEGAAEPWGLLTSWLPSSIPLNLPITGRAATKESDGDWKLTLRFEGLAPDAEEGIDAGECEIDNSRAEDPIQTFPLFDKFAAKYGGRVDSDNGFTGFPLKIKNPDGSGLVKNPAFGVTSYLTGNRILAVSFNLRQYDDTWLKNQYKIDRPKVPRAASRLAENIGGRQWLKLGARVSQRGNCWQYRLQWMEGIWFPEVYAARE